LQVTEFLAGGSLRAMLRDPLKALEWFTRVKIAQQIAAGMDHLQKLSIVHRDLKVITRAAFHFFRFPHLPQPPHILF
jgi:serine/threonine protein kinase